MNIKIAIGVAVAGLIGVSAISSQVTPQSEAAIRVEPIKLAPFSFRELSLGSSLQDATNSEIVTNCLEYGGETTCSLSRSFVGPVPISLSYVDFNRDGFASMLATFEPSSFEILKKMLTRTYGRPCDAAIRTLKDPAAINFSDNELAWCFERGVMTLDRHDRSNATVGVLRFEEPARAPTPPEHLSPSRI